MSVTDSLLANNKAYAAGFSGPLPLPPGRHLAVLACMDARLDVYRALGLGEGEAHVIRNAGGAVTEDAILADTGLRPAWAAESFPDLEADVVQSLARIQASAFIPHKDSVRGFVFDVATGRLSEVRPG